MTPLDRFLRVAPPIDDHRDDAARCCEETARFERGERPALRLDPADLEHNEFSDAAAGIASEVAMAVLAAFKQARARVYPAVCWDLAAQLLRSGWQRGHRIQPIDTRISVAIAELTVGSRIDPKLAARLGIDLAPVIATLEGHLETLRAELHRMMPEPYPQHPGAGPEVVE